MKLRSVYHGNVQVYLEGQGALQVLEANGKDQHVYYIGSPESKILIKDFRKEPIAAAKIALQGQKEAEFADVFNQPAKVKVYKTPAGIEIELRKCRQIRNIPILWMGVNHDHKMPARKIHWRIIQPISETETAFAILTPHLSLA